ncbi:MULTISPECIES: pyridoxamine 5'-phosphate oxidase family protein [unclassified Pseudofrankia]|uniref:pyridoxamine 5'-phosphate oxidase family protein n=1 Tax=unclassified Pseudofrankia TaxID=2994372 RepID=UPI0008DA167B|nr:MULTISPECIES: TIGR03618 family F420-dependent PPOX class oxidoreductase [unclassified Pseudofrankia]MDT3445565.1 TIGR03618 family F420-dependent PPOX class oxidoreductase [Pseudofrankia sp. BMG5.37]OHV47832.1 PPOX class F420-dependent enzyme [Pseudofrankia sp. BMG5.36]
MGANRRSQVEMTAEEISAYVATRRTATLVSLGPAGHPHAVAMWFAVLDGVLWFETKAKAQKALNIRRDPRVTVLMEDGLTYDTLRGVSMEGRAEIVDDPEALWAVGVNVWERYNGPYSDEAKPLVEFMLHKRIAVRFDVQRTRSWDHRKLGMSPIPLGGTTAPHHAASDTL